MQYKYYINPFASTYGSNAYDTSVYNGASTGSTGGTGASSGGSTGTGGALVNTGVAVAAIVTIAAVVLLAAIVVRVWKRSSKKTDTPAAPEA